MLSLVTFFPPSSLFSFSLFTLVLKEGVAHDFYVFDKKTKLIWMNKIDGCISEDVDCEVSRLAAQPLKDEVTVEYTKEGTSIK